MTQDELASWWIRFFYFVGFPESLVDEKKTRLQKVGEDGNRIMIQNVFSSKNCTMNEGIQGVESFFCWDTIIRIGVSIGESFRNMLPFFSLLLREGERVKGAFGAFQRLDPFELQKHIGLFF